MLADNYLLSKEQTEQFKAFSDNLAIAIGDALEQKLSESDMNDSIKNVDETILKIHNYLSNELGNTIGNAISKQIEEQLLPVFEKLNTAIDKLNNSGMDAISKGFQDSAGKELQGLSTTLQDMTNNLNIALEKMEETSSSVNKDLGESISNVIAELNNNMVQMQQQFEAREQTLKEVSDEVANKLTTDISTIMSRLDQGVVQVTEQTKELSNTLSNTSVQANENIASVFTNTEEQLTRLMDDYTQKNAMINTQMFEFIKNIQTELSEQQAMLGKLNSQVSTIVERAGNVADKFADVAQPVNDTVNALNSSIKGTLETARYYNDQMVQGIGDMKAVVRDNTRNIGELSTNLEKAKQGFIVATKGYENANNELEQILETISNNLLEYNDAMRGNYEKSLKTYSDSVAEACQKLYSVVNELVETLDEYNNK